MVAVYVGSDDGINCVALASGSAERHSQRMLIVLALATAIPVVPAGRAFRCTPTRIWDGDGPLFSAPWPQARRASGSR